MAHTNHKTCTSSLTILARLNHIGRVGQLIDDCAEIAGFDGRTNYACQLAIEEVCENIIKHGYGTEGTGSIEVIVHAQPKKLKIEIIDSAPPFNVAAKPEENIVELDDPPIGGLGLRIIHKVMDKVEYYRRGDQNHLILSKSCRQNSN